MGEWAQVFNQLIEAVKKRFEETDKHLLVVTQAIRERDQLILALKENVENLNRKVWALENSAVEKILLEESKESGKS